VEEFDKNRKMDKITTIVMHKKVHCCVVTINRSARSAR